MLNSGLRRVALRSVLRRPLQSALFIAGIALGVALIVAIDLANGSASRGFSLFTESLVGRATHVIDGGASGLDDSIYTRLRVDLGVQNAAPVVDDYVQALEMDAQPLHVFGVDPFAEPPFRNYLSANAAGVPVGELTAFLTEPDTALLAQSLADQYKLKVGDKITFVAGNANGQLTATHLAVSQ